jgi:hypothetical protein
MTDYNMEEGAEGEHTWRIRTIPVIQMGDKKVFFKQPRLEERTLDESTKLSRGNTLTPSSSSILHGLLLLGW